MHRIVTWDIEIRHPVHEVGGWQAVREGAAGVSVLAIKDTHTGRYHFYDDTCLDDALDHLNSADLVVGFNSIGFDAEIVKALTGSEITAPHYDILAEVWKSFGKRPKGYSLDEIAQRTINLGKNSDGAFATTLVARGHWGKLFDYCTNDVHVTSRLFNHIVDNGWILSPDREEVWLDPPSIREHA